MWTADEIAWFFDGKEIRTDRQIERIANNCEYEMMEIIVGLGLNWPLENGQIYNDRFEVDYVRAYKPKTENTAWSYKQGGTLGIDNTIHVQDFSSNQMSQSKMAIVNGAGNIFYRSKTGGLCDYWWNGNALQSSCFGSINDVAGEVTYSPADGRVYYRSTANELKYVVNGVASLTGATGCKGSIAVGSNGTVYYRGTFGRIYHLYNNGSSWSLPISNVNNCAGTIVVNNTSQQVYYRGNDYNLYRVTKTNGVWGAREQLTTTGKVTDNIVVDEALNKVYYIGTDHRLWEYAYWGSAWHNTLMYFNHSEYEAYNGLAYDPQKGILYFQSYNGRLSYFFTDKFSDGTGYGAKFYSTAVQYDGLYVWPANATQDGWHWGYTLVRNDGNVYYRGRDGRLYECWWETGREVVNPACDNDSNPTKIY